MSQSGSSINNATHSTSSQENSNLQSLSPPPPSSDDARFDDNVFARIKFSQKSTASTVSSYEARMKAILDSTETFFPTGRGSSK
ncbi:hypothetical protein QBC43DRAFT_293020 [Cladorrhinum sp. PSN259]|nr:hypothetical protein QBC43DRAFT_293020 [Cladorrhinum sp. PSN259]